MVAKGRVLRETVTGGTLEFGCHPSQCQQTDSSWLIFPSYAVLLWQLLQTNITSHIM